jgi:hypothetical protein
MSKIHFTREFIEAEDRTTPKRDMPQNFTPLEMTGLIILVGVIATGLYWVTRGAGWLFGLMYEWIFTF